MHWRRLGVSKEHGSWTSSISIKYEVYSSAAEYRRRSLVLLSISIERSVEETSRPWRPTHFTSNLQALNWLGIFHTMYLVSLFSSFGRGGSSFVTLYPTTLVYPPRDQVLDCPNYLNFTFWDHVNWGISPCGQVVSLNWVSLVDKSSQTTLSRERSRAHDQRNVKHIITYVWTRRAFHFCLGRRIWA